MKVLLLGATGLVGNEILTKLINNPNIEKITTITRSSIDLTSPKLNSIILPLDQWFQDNSIFHHHDVSISSFGTTRAAAGSIENFKTIDYGTNLKFAEISKQGGIPKFILISTMGANVKSSLAYFKIKGQLEHDIEQLKFDDLFILRPGGLVGDRKPGKGKGFGEFFINKVSWIWPISYFIRPTKAETIGSFVNGLIDNHGKKIYEAKQINEATY